MKVRYVVPDSERTAHASGTVASVQRRSAASVQRGSFVTRIFSVAATVSVLTGWLIAGSTTAWAAQAHFPPAGSSATWDGNTVTVTFREEGVDAGTESSILLTARASVDASCNKNGMVLLTTHSSATVTDVSDYPAGHDGVVTGTRELAMKLEPPTVSGLDCAMHVVRTFTVVVRDLDTGATLTLP
jgi:hypothetical protein